MAYCSQTDLETEFGLDRLIQLTDRHGVWSLDAEVLGAAIARADREINRYLATRGLAPIEADAVQDIACDIAFYHLHKAGIPEDVQKRYDQALTALSGIADGRLSAADSAGGVASSASALSVEFGESRRVFSVEY
jgi:phage gp36-like protein